MNKIVTTGLPAILLSLLFLSSATAAEATAPALYKQHCASCHSEDRLGAQGPALLPQNLKRLKKKQAVQVISQGRPATQMQGFSKQLQPAQIQALADYIYTPLAKTPMWGMGAIKGSQIIQHPNGSLPDHPKYKADMDNLFMVVELGDHHATLLDGDRFEPITRVATRFAVHGGPKWAKGGRYIFFLSRDGWVSKFDVYNLTWVAEIRAGINARNLAVSHDGRYVMVANYLPHSLVLLDAKNLDPIKVIEAKDSEGNGSRVSAVYTADPRSSFIAAMKDIPEVWEINYEDTPPVGFGKWVHDYRPDSGEETSLEHFPIRKLKLKGILDDFFLTQNYEQIIGSTRGGGAQVVDLDIGRAIAGVDLPGLPHLSSAITWKRNGTTVLATPNIRKPEVTIVDTETWKVIKRIPTRGPGFFMRSHEKTPYAWTDVFFGPNKDLMHVIDKQTLEIVKTLKPAPGKTSAHVEFTKDGKYALVSIWDMDGALVIYDAGTLKEIKRIPMKKPSGKYNVHNKLTRSAGTSH
jgi:mono/diheme cytochrome c family protein